MHNEDIQILRQYCCEITFYYFTDCSIEGEEFKRVCESRETANHLFLDFIGVYGHSTGQGMDQSSFNAIMLTALSHTAGAVIKKGFLLLLCLPDFLNLQPL